jgi:DNA repair exonuclease SbcCD ATPase subunit
LIRKNEAVNTQKELYSDSLNRLQEFEKNNDTEALSKENDESVISLDEINIREREIDERLEVLRKGSELDRRQLDSLNERLDEAADLSDRLESIEELISGKSDTSKLLEETRAYLNKAKESLTARYIGPLRASFSKYYSLITGNDASGFMLDANLDLTVEGGGLQHAIGYLSYGYKDLVGVCMRLSLADAMYPDEKPVLILDDPFVNLDEHNRVGAMKLLEAVSKEYQIVHFSCRE